MNKGIVTQGQEVHHIKGIDTNPELALDEKNLILLCKHCHDTFHNRISPLEKFLNERVGRE